jgi:hypothetical protein
MPGKAALQIRLEICSADFIAPDEFVYAGIKTQQKIGTVFFGAALILPGKTVNKREQMFSDRGKTLSGFIVDMDSRV